MDPINKAISALATVLLIGAAGSPASANCDDSSLQGQYSFRVQGENVGVYDATGALHLFSPPLPVNGAGSFMFDGNGSLTKVDYNMGNGASSISSANPLTDDGFRTGQTGTYSISADCTGTLTFNVPGGRVVTLALMVVS